MRIGEPMQDPMYLGSNVDEHERVVVRTRADITYNCSVLSGFL